MTGSPKFVAPNGDSILITQDWLVGHVAKGNQVVRIPVQWIKSVKVDRERFFFAVEYICKIETFNGHSHAITFDSKAIANEVFQAIQSVIVSS